MNRFEEMKKLATEEAINLKQHATKLELESLCFEELDPMDETRCIYGQMTGDCYNERAVELIVNCCPRVYKASTRFGGIDPEADLNGAPVQSKNRCTEYHSAIEMLIVKENGGQDAQKKLIAFLKDETQTLEL
jgi:hypothetical protein